MELPENRRRTAILALIAVVLAGFIAAIPLSSANRTEMACLCPDNESKEVQCNHIGEKDYVFFTGFFNVFIEKDGREVVMCENGEHVDTVDRFDESSLEYEFIH